LQVPESGPPLRVSFPLPADRRLRPAPPNSCPLVPRPGTIVIVSLRFWPPTMMEEIPVVGHRAESPTVAQPANPEMVSPESRMTKESPSRLMTMLLIFPCVARMFSPLPPGIRR
jgi:hypothetical protein